MITAQNYYDHIRAVEFSTLPEPLRKGHEFIKKVTNNGADWANYHASEAIKKTVNTYFEKLSEHLGKNKSKKQTVSAEKTKTNKSHSKATNTAKPTHHKMPEKTDAQPVLVERIPDEIRFIKRFAALHGKSKTKEQILSFINSLQKAILEKRIRKTSHYAEQVKYIQDKLIEVYNAMKTKVAIELKPEILNTLKNIGGSEKLLMSVGFIKRYIGLNEKPGMKDKAKALLGQINRAFEKGHIRDTDPYIVELNDIKKNIESFIAEKASKILRIEKNTLSGLEDILGCACNSLNGFAEKPTVMNSMDFAEMKFRTLGFTGKWKQLIGDPSSNFTAMVFGRPKMGKSYLCIDFAGYLARHHGKVLYVAKEEGLDLTLQEKLNDKDVKHPNLYVASELPRNLSQYDFIFLDSVNKLGLQPDDLTRLKAAYPQKSFIYIFQSTKDGNFRGHNSFQHDVDVVIEVPEKGKAVQYGRFNQGGEISIFS